jgi:GT2 family glycosyltransferase
VEQEMTRILVPDRARVAALIACHNRRDLTVTALCALSKSRDFFDLSVVLFDNGSTDGAADAVRAQFPDTILLIGDRSAFWNGGMYRASQYALELNADAYLWLNDDVELDGDAFVRLLSAWKDAVAQRSDPAAVLVGATRNAKGEITYGGMRRASSRFVFRFERLPETTAAEPIDTLNGNIVLVTAAAVEKVGILDPGFYHMYGDIDYGLRANRAGIPVLLLPGSLGICEANKAADLSLMTIVERWRHVFKSHRGIQTKSLWRIVRRHSGLYAPLHFVPPYRKLFYPAAWLRT